MSALKKYGVAWLLLTLLSAAFLFDRVMPQSFMRLWLPVVALAALAVVFIFSHFRLRISLNVATGYKCALFGLACLMAAAVIFIPRALNNRALLSAAGDDFDVTVHGQIEPKKVDYTLMSLERGRQRVDGASGLRLPDAAIKIEIYQDVGELVRLTGLEDWAAGFTSYAAAGPIIHIPTEQDSSAIDDTPGHEVVHAVVYQYIGARIELLPDWFSEGLAQYIAEAGVWNLPGRDVARLGLWRQKGSVMTPDYFYDYSTDEPRSDEEVFFFYDAAHEFMRYLADAHGRETPWRVIEQVKQGKSFDQAFESAAGNSFEECYLDWTQAFWGISF